mgnify:FL=1
MPKAKSVRRGRKSEVLWMAWHINGDQYLPWWWGCSRNSCWKRIRSETDNVKHYSVHRVRVVEILPKKAAKNAAKKGRKKR